VDLLARLNAAQILIAESNRASMARLTEILQDAGYNVQNAYFGGDALWAMHHGRFDLALLDTTMLDEHGQPLAEAMAQAAPIPWIAVVEAQGPASERALRAGAIATIERTTLAAPLLGLVEAAFAQGRRSDPDLSTPRGRGSAALDDAHDAATSAVLQRRLREQQTLSTLARSLSSVLDVNSLLAQIVEAAVSLTNAEEGLLLLPDEEEQALFIRAHKGIDSETASSFRIKTENTLAGQVFRSGKPILVGDQGWQKIKTEYLVQSLLYVPLSSKGTTIGVLGVNNIKSSRTFTDHDCDLLQDLAAHAAIAIDKARLFEESLQRTTELQVLVEAGEAANSTLAIDRVLSAIANQLIEALGASQCYTAERNAATGDLSLLYASARAAWPSDKGPVRADQRERGVEDAFRHQCIITVEPEALLADQVAEWLPHRYSAERIVYVPLFAHDQRIGLITLYHISNPFYADAYPPGTMTQIQQMALDGVLQALGATSQAPHRLLFRAAARVLELVGANWCEIALWDEAHQVFRLILSYGEGIWPEEPRPVIDPARYPQLIALIDRQSAFTNADASGLRRLVDARYARSVLGVPLIIKERTAGVVVLVDARHTRRFASREVNLAQALVLQAANALENARLFRELERSLDELHRTQNKLVHAARLSAMGELSAAVAHQINNPLTTILADSELLMRGAEDDPRLEALEAIHRAGQRAHAVVRRLLTMARHEPVDDRLEPIDVNETIQNTLMIVRDHILQGGVDLRLSLEEDLLPVGAPTGQLEDVWLNLLLNAREAVNACATQQVGITSRGVPEDRMIEVRVWDTGVGIPLSQQKQIFEPFFTTKPPGQGTGLGLYICRQVVETCGGTLHVKSAEGEGTQFCVRLPIYDRRD